MTTPPDEAPAERDETPSLFDLTVAALAGVGRMVVTDRDLGTFDVLPDGELVAGPDAILGLVLSTPPAVAFYAVRPEPVPEPARSAVAELTVRLNTVLTTSTVEFDPDTGILSVRAGIRLGAVDLGPLAPDADGHPARALFAGLLIEALDEVAATARRCRGPVDGVTSSDLLPLEAYRAFRAQAT